MSSRSRRWGVAVFAYLVLAIIVKQVLTEFDPVEVALNVVMAAGMAWLVAKMLERHWRRSSR